MGTVCARKVMGLRRHAVLEINKGYKNVHIPFDPATSLLGLYPKEIVKMGKGPMCTKILIAVLFVVAKNWKLRGYPSIEECLNKLWCILQ